MHSDRARRRSDARKPLVRLPARQALPEKRAVRRAGGDRKQSLAQRGRHGRAGPGLEQRRCTEEAACLPDPEPGELFEDVNVQLFGLDGDRGAAAPEMSGFVDDYARQPWPWTPEDPSGIMHYFLPAQVPIISRLALEFGVSDRWHASTPSETWPNRYFAHCGTAGGYVNNSLSRFPVPVAAHDADDLPASRKIRLQLENLFSRYPADRQRCSISGPRSRPISAGSRRNSSGIAASAGCRITALSSRAIFRRCSRTRCRTTSTRRTICSTASS